MAAVSIDYTSKDFEGLRASMLAYASTALPEWTSRSSGDLGVVMVELMAYVGDIMSYYVDRAQQEAYLSTATLDSSIVALANMLGYTPQTGIPATGTVSLTLDAAVSTATPVPAGTTLVATSPAGVSLSFETTSSVTLTSTTRTASVPVRHGVTVTQRAVGQSTGAPGQFFVLDDTPVVEGSIAVSVDYDSTTTEAWSRVDYLADSGPSDKTFTVSLNAAGSLRIGFGDGVNGLVPAPGLRVYVSYIRGGGSVANLAANTRFSLANPVAGVSVYAVSGVSQTSAMAGGADPDSTADIRRNVPAVLRTRDRAVTLDDYTTLAIADPSIVKAKASARNSSMVYLYVLTTDSTASTATDTRARVQSQLQRKTPAGVTLSLFPAVQVPFTVGTSGTPVAITAYDTYQNTTVSQAVQAALNAHFSTANVDLGQRLSVSDIYGVIVSVPGVRATAVPSYQIGTSAATSVDTALSLWQLPVLSNIYVTVTGGI